MAAEFDLAAYLNEGAEQLIRNILKATLRNPKETAFLRRYQKSHLAMEARRAALEAEGLHIPMFLIASITNACNLYCKGCYARANGQCGSAGGKPPLSAQQWGGIFDQAAETGIPFILLAGGEPMMRPDVLQTAAAHGQTIFPIFTNGTLIDAPLIKLFDKHRNLVPIVSLEGGEEATDKRRGKGAFVYVQNALDTMEKARLLFGVSLTVTTENRAEVMSPEFIETLHKKGCRLVFFIEYVPVTPGTESLAPDDKERQLIEQGQENLRGSFPGMVFLSFPGDEKHMGGCLAAGRGFFHINAQGAAEPCPFSPYSDLSLLDHTLLEVLQSPFFQMVRELNAQEENHVGGCALFEKEAQVRALLFSRNM
ncbi:MAG: radical SAM protein [Clostridiales bacterium]|nr:radical SAM protein [Clostridiales bacterium]